MSRRQFLTEAGVGAAGLVAAAVAGRAQAAGEAPAALGAIRLGSLEVSRLILGSNPFFGFAHQTAELAEEMKAWYTDERIVAVLDEAAAHGITTVAAPPYERWRKLWAEYRRANGRLAHWIAQPDGKPEGMKDEISTAVEAGAAAVFVQGARVDEQFVAGRAEVVGEWVAHIKGLGVPAGMASHRAVTHLEAEARGFATDFYYQCFFNPNEGYRDEDRQAAVATIARLDKPVVGYKILGAGRLPAQEAFTFAFRHLRAKDGVCVGMFPKHRPDEVTENAGLARALGRPA